MNPRKPLRPLLTLAAAVSLTGTAFALAPAGQAATPDPVGLQEGVAPTQVGPGSLLHVRDDDQAPLEALGAVGSEQPDRLSAHASVGEGVGRDLLGAERGEELADTGVAALLLGTSGLLEQRADGVEVAVSQPGEL